MQTKIFHPKLQNLFTLEQLELLATHSYCYKDADGLVHILFCNMNFGHYEIYCDCEAKMMDRAIIYVYFTATSVGKNIDSEEFWELYNKSYPVKCTPICINC